MTEHLKIRQTIEFDVEITDIYDAEGALNEFRQRLLAGEVGPDDAEGFVTILASEIVEQKHTPNYVFDCDYDAELFHLIADGERIFSDRDHNKVALKWGELTGIEVEFYKGAHNRKPGAFLDYGDPDECWKRLNR